MDERIIEIEADSLEEARRALYTDDVLVLEESILTHAKIGTVESVADNAEGAFEKARERIPPKAKIETQTVKLAAKRVVLQVEGNDEESAGKGKAEVIESVSLHKKGRKGLFGFGRTPNVYDVVISQPAVVEVRFRERARLQAIVTDYLANDLLRSIEEVRSRNAPWEEVLRLLNPKKDDRVEKLLDGLLVPDMIDPESALNIIEHKCRENEGVNWERVIQEAHHEALAARIRLWIELRGLDAELASVFMFYTSVDWYPRSNREPTGIPMHTRLPYGRRPPDSRYREIIPRYSADKEAFSELERRVIAWKLHDLCKQFLQEDGQGEATATLKQKCVAMLKAKKLTPKVGE
jgi:hypothetical protein